jgi:hypothetical protein
MIGVLNWFIRSSFLMLLLPVSILFAIFASRRDALFQNIYKLFGQALVPMVLVASFFLIINAMLVTNIIVKEMVPILNSERMVYWYASENLKDTSKNVDSKTSDLKLFANKIEADLIEVKKEVTKGEWFSWWNSDEPLEFGKMVFSSALIYGKLQLAMVYIIDTAYLLITLVMNLLLLRYFWKADDFVSEVVNVQIKNDVFNADQLLQRFGANKLASG